MSPLLQVEHVSRRFGGQTGDQSGGHTALDDVSFSVEPGEILGIIGRSGAGKTTLLRCLNGLERPDHGRIVMQGRDIAALGERELVPLRRRIGLVFQHFGLLASRSAAANIELPLQILGMPRPERQARVNALLDLVGLAGHAHKRPAQLSGGQKQRVGIARALAADPLLLLCDEATSALDPETTVSILDLLADINRRLGLTIVLITHEMDVIRRIAQRVVVMDHGRVVEDAPTAALLRGEAAHPVTRAFLHGESRPLPDTVAEWLRPEASAGAVPVVRIALESDAAWHPVLSALGREGVDATVLHARAGAQGGQLHAEFVLRLSRPSEAAMAFLHRTCSSVEVLGHVPADR